MKSFKDGKSYEAIKRQLFSVNVNLNVFYSRLFYDHFQVSILAILHYTVWIDMISVRSFYSPAILPITYPTLLPTVNLTPKFKKSLKIFRRDMEKNICIETLMEETVLQVRYRRPQTVAFIPIFYI